MIKVLHLATDEKFIDRGVSFFKEDLRILNHLLVVSDSTVYNHVKSSQDFQILSSELDKIPKIAATYDILVIHSLIPYFYKTIDSLHEKFIIWIGMGFDYYDFIYYTQYHSMMEKTKEFYINNVSELDRNIIEEQINNSKPPSQKISLLNKINIFCPVLPSEYDLIVPHSDNAPIFCPWNYIYEDLEDVMKNYQFSSNNSIIIGNSASPTNNHLDIICLINKDNIPKNSKIITPLSYGNMKYANLVSTVFDSTFGEQYIPVRDFMELHEYMKLLSMANVCIMAHKRQQGMGNIIMMLHLGYKIFMNKESPAYTFLIENGVKVYTLEDLHCLNHLITNDLDENIKKKNSKIIKQLFSANLNRLRTKKIVDLMEKYVNRVN